MYPVTDLRSSFKENETGKANKEQQNKKPQSEQAPFGPLSHFHGRNFVSGCSLLHPTKPDKARTQLETLLQKLPQTDNTYLSLKRILAYTDALEGSLKEPKPLSFYSRLKIASIVEEHFAKSFASTPTEYLSVAASQSPRALVLDYQKKQFLVLSKGCSTCYAEGAERTFSIATLFHHTEAHSVQHKHYAHLVNIDSDDVESIKKQVELAEEIHQDIFLVVEHTTRNDKKKISVFEELYEMNLEQALQKGYKFEAAQIFAIFQQAVSTIWFLHRNGLVHRDIKGANLLVKGLQEGHIRAKLTDFGKTYNPEDAQVEYGYGTTSFSSPERFEASTALDDLFEQGKADDLFALGCTLYLALFPDERILPWGPEVDRAIAAKGESSQRNSAATTKYTQAYEKLLQKSLTEPNPEQKKLIDLCLALLEKDPQKRLKADELSFS